MRQFLFNSAYRSPLVSRQNAKADYVLVRLFASLSGDTCLLSTYVQQRIYGSADAGTIAHEVAFFLDSLTGRGAPDLYGELLAPTDHAMGHRVR
jgi:dGTP triphosphohydrolase